MKLETQKIVISNDALSQEVNGETVILDLQSESYFGLDEVGTRVWQLLQEEGDVQKTIDQMLKEFDVKPERLTADVNELLRKLIDNGLVVIDEK